MILRKIFSCDSDLNRFVDSMLFPSGTTVAQEKFSGNGMEYQVSLEVSGDIAVTYHGETYHSSEDFPDELVGLIRKHPNEWDITAPEGMSTDGGMTLFKPVAETADTRLYDWLSPQGCESYRDVKIAPAAFFMAYSKYYSGINISTLSKGKKTFLLDFGDHYSVVRHDPDDGKKLDYLSWVGELWSAFGDIPLDGDSDDIDISFLHFPAGTNRFEIWSWFQETFDIGIDMLQDYC